MHCLTHKQTNGGPASQGVISGVQRGGPRSGSHGRMKQSLVELQSGRLVLCGAAARPQTSSNSGHWSGDVHQSCLPRTVGH